MTRVAILDCGMGNLRSVEKALEGVGAQAEITSDPARAGDADGVVLPGVGAFPPAMARVRELGFDALIADRVRASAPVLGVWKAPRAWGSSRARSASCRRPA
jgi:imidazole glycerol-phosphate synthase subunit HisH